MTNHWIDIKNSDCILIMGSNAAENHPVSFKYVTQALENGADVVLTGRAADPALFLAPLIHRFGWKMDDWDRLGKGTLAGHPGKRGMNWISA